ncbi:MAG: VWA domain-containing protein [Betaproteobacteria bacterium]|nr:VWA domain-containing protein [Betaproteobacteria bacterium]
MTASRSDQILALDVSLTPLRPALLLDGTGEMSVLVRVSAPEAPAVDAPVTPLSLALVIDRSGSMDGGRLEAALGCARNLVQRLRDQDEVSVIIYDDQAEVLLPLTAAAQARDSIDSLLAGVVVGGSTALYDGWMLGASQLAPRTGGDRMCRVILLSDGQANRGLTDEAEICERVRRLAGAGVTTTTVGLGEGFNESLMTGIAKAGHGNALYGDRAEDLAEPFDAEIGLLAQIACRDLRLIAGSATRRWVLCNDYSRSGEETAELGAWALPDLVAGSEAWAVFRAPMDSVIRAQARSRQGMALHVTVNGRDPLGRRVTQQASLAPLPLVDESQWRALPPDELVSRRVTELRAAELQRAARLAVEEGDWERAEQILREAETLAADQPWVKGVVAHLQGLLQRRDRLRFGKEAMFASHRMSTRITTSSERAEYDEVEEAALPSFLRKKLAQGRRTAT